MGANDHLSPWGEKTRVEKSLEGQLLLEIDRHEHIIKSLLGKAPLYQKLARVHARPALIGERIETILPGGFRETVSIAAPGDWVVTNPLGESYTVSSESFTRRYEKTEDREIFQARGYTLAIQNPFETNLLLRASEEKRQHGDPNCFLAICCTGGCINERNPYIIARSAFLKTYRRA